MYIPFPSCEWVKLGCQTTAIKRSASSLGQFCRTEFEWCRERTHNDLHAVRNIAGRLLPLRRRNRTTGRAQPSIDAKKVKVAEVSCQSDVTEHTHGVANEASLQQLAQAMASKGIDIPHLLGLFPISLDDFNAFLTEKVGAQSVAASTTLYDAFKAHVEETAKAQLSKLITAVEAGDGADDAGHDDDDDDDDDEPIDAAKVGELRAALGVPRVHSGKAATPAMGYVRNAAYCAVFIQALMRGHRTRKALRGVYASGASTPIGSSASTSLCSTPTSDVGGAFASEDAGEAKDADREAATEKAARFDALESQRRFLREMEEADAADEA